MSKKELTIAVMAGWLGGMISGPFFKAAPALASSTYGEVNVLSVKKLIITDGQGVARLGCGVSDDGKITLAVSDSKGKVRIGFGVLADGSPSLDFYDLNNKARMVLGLNHEAPFLVFNDKNEIHRILLRQSPTGLPHLNFNDTDGKLRATLGDSTFQIGKEEKTESSLVFFKKGGDILWKAPGNDLGTR